MPEADWVARTLAARGVTVVSIDYRLGGRRMPGATPPAPTTCSPPGAGPSRTPTGSASTPPDSRSAARAPAPTSSPARCCACCGSRSGRRSEDALETEGARDGSRDGAGAPPQPATSRRRCARLLDRRPARLDRAAPAGVFLAYPTLLAVQPAPDAALRAAARRRTPTPTDSAPSGAPDVRAVPRRARRRRTVPAVPGRAAASDLAGFPPVLMINDEADELRVSGEVFAATLVEAGVPLELVVEPGTEHGHLNRPERARGIRLDRARRALDRGSRRPLRGSSTRSHDAAARSGPDRRPAAT